MARYASCATYEDRGSSVTIHLHEDGRPPATHTLSFSTLFDRARDAFRFEWESPKEWHDEARHAVIWQPASGLARLWWNVDHIVKIIPLGDAIAFQTGVSSGTAATVPWLLLGKSLSEDYVDSGVEDHEGTPLRCFVRRKGNYESRLYVSDDDSLRMHIERDVVSTEGLDPPQRAPRLFRIDRTVDYAPEFENAIDPSRFDFVPPPP